MEPVMLLQQLHHQECMDSHHRECPNSQDMECHNNQDMVCLHNSQDMDSQCLSQAMVCLSNPDMECSNLKGILNNLDMDNLCQVLDNLCQVWDSHNHTDNHSHMVSLSN